MCLVNKTKRTAAAIVLIALVTSCSPPAPNNPARGKEAGSSGGPVELKLWSNLTVAAQSNAIKEQAEQCANGLGDNVTVSFEGIPFDSMYSRMVTAFRSGSGPDVMNTLEGAVAFGQSADYIVPVDDVVDSHGRKDFVPSYLDAVSKDEKTWAVPDWALHQEVYYRKDLFAKHNLQIPKTWPELLQTAKTIDEGEGGVRGFAVPMASALVAPQTWYQFLYANNVYTFDPKTGEYAFEDNIDAAIEATQYMMDLYRAASPEASRTWTWNDFRNGFAKGDLGMVLDFGAVVGLAKEQNPQILENIGVFSLPGPTANEKPGAVLGGGYFYMVGKSNNQREALAKDLVKCMMDPELTAKRANTRPIFALPATSSAAETDTYKSNELVQQFADEIKTIREESLPSWHRYGMEAGLNPLAGQIEATTFIGDNLQAAAAGNKSVDQAVRDINTELKRLAKVE